MCECSCSTTQWDYSFSSVPYSEDQQKELLEQRDRCKRLDFDLRLRFINRKYRTERGEEFAKHGFGRRLQTLAHCIIRVFEAIPPDFERPRRDEVQDATAFLQAFVINVFGAIDNLAHIWAAEAGVTRQNGRPFAMLAIGFMPRQQEFRQTLPIEFSDYLIASEEWFAYLENYRHSLAHRIPLYIPPIAFTPEDGNRFKQVQAAKIEALRALKVDEWEELDRQEKQLGVFQPMMMHSYGEGARPMVLHPQMICDFLTVAEMSERILMALDNLQ